MLREAGSLAGPRRAHGRMRRDLLGEFDRFLAVGKRLERGVEALQDLNWEIRDKGARYRDLLDSQADVLLRRDEDGRLTYVNRAFSRVFGIKGSAALGQAFLPRVLSGDRPAPLAPGGALRRQRYVQEIETARGARWFEWEEHAVSAADVGVVEVQCRGRDITESLRAEVELKQARAQAEAANRAKSRFLAAMSHEIRTPMNGILGMTTLLADTQLLPDQRTYAEAIEGSARALLALIDEILDLSKIEADKLTLNCAPLALEECVQRVVELLAPKAREKGIDIACSIDPALPRLLLGDEVRVRQIVINLVDNAIKFTDSGGVLITVGCAEAHTPPAANAPAVAIAVRDTGIGIAAESLPALFAEFAQVDAAVRRRQSGTGLGLAISRRLTRAMGGDILVETAPGRGSTFTALIHLRPFDVSAPSPSDPEDHALRSKAEDHALRSKAEDHALRSKAEGPAVHRVLLALDRPPERCALRLALEGAGIAVEEGTTAGTAADAAARTRAPFTTIVVDGACGSGVAAQLLHDVAAASAPLLGIVVLDAAAKAEFAQFRDAGFYAYALRPIRPRTILALLAGRRLGKHAADREPPGRRFSLRASRTSPLSVLLVEDNDVNALLARHLLEKAGCGVRMCVNGREAVDAVGRALSGAEPGYDLILMDARMPVLDGLEATRQIKELYAVHRDRAVPCPPIIAVTASAFDDDRRDCLAAGMDDYLAKPFDAEVLLRVIDRWCGAKGSDASPQGLSAQR